MLFVVLPAKLRDFGVPSLIQSVSFFSSSVSSFHLFPSCLLRHAPLFHLPPSYPIQVFFFSRSHSILFNQRQLSPLRGCPRDILSEGKPALHLCNLSWWPVALHGISQVKNVNGVWLGAGTIAPVSGCHVLPWIVYLSWSSRT